MRKRKMILGIAVVICLDVAFILSMMHQFQTAEIARALDETPILAPIPIFRDNETAVETTETGQKEAATEIVEVREVEPAAQPRVRRVRRSERAANSDVPEPRFAKNKFEPPVFKDTIIWIERPTAYEFESRPISEAADQKPAVKALAAKPVERKKRSFFSKALPVIKKPYDWMKALVSKLN